MLSLSVNRLTKIYRGRGNIVALDDISFTYKGNGVLCLLGPNGAGKTTLISILATILKPTSGKALICGYDVVKDAEKVRELIAYVPQNLAVEYALSVKDNLELFSMLYNMKYGEEEIRKLLDYLGLADKTGVRAVELSGGMLRKLQIARAFMSNRDIYLLDEPTIELDYESYKRVVDLIREKARSSLIVMATNNLHEAELLCQQVAFFNTRLIAYGSIDEIRRIVGSDMLVLEIRLKFGGCSSRISDLLEKLGLDAEYDHDIIRVKLHGDDRERLIEVFNELLSVRRFFTNIVIREPSLEEVFVYLFRGGRRDHEKEF